MTQNTQQEEPKYKVGKRYIIDAEYNNGGEVELVEIYGRNCKVKDPETGSEWVTMTDRLTEIPADKNLRSQLQQSQESLKIMHDCKDEWAERALKAEQTIGWEPSCKCECGEIVRPIVYDPFMGSGTTATVAKLLGCDYAGSELNPEYMDINAQRRHDELGLFNQ